MAEVWVVYEPYKFRSGHLAVRAWVRGPEIGKEKKE